MVNSINLPRHIAFLGDSTPVTSRIWYYLHVRMLPLKNKNKKSQEHVNQAEKCHTRIWFVKNDKLLPEIRHMIVNIRITYLGVWQSPPRTCSNHMECKDHTNCQIYFELAHSYDTWNSTSPTVQAIITFLLEKKGVAAWLCLMNWKHSWGKIWCYQLSAALSRIRRKEAIRADA